MIHYQLLLEKKLPFSHNRYLITLLVQLLKKNMVELNIQDISCVINNNIMINITFLNQENIDNLKSFIKDSIEALLSLYEQLLDEKKLEIMSPATFWTKEKKFLLLNGDKILKKELILLNIKDIVILSTSRGKGKHKL